MSANGGRYFSKISRVTPWLLFAGFAGSAGLVSVACQKDAVVDQRVVTLYTLADPPKTPQPVFACMVPSTAYAQYSGNGDFQPDPSSPPQEGHLLDVASPELDAIPQGTRQLSLDVRLGTDRWRGFGSVAGSGPVALSLWPIGHECELTTSVDARPGSTLTPYDDHHVLVTGGAGLASFIVDFSNGAVTQLSRTQDIDAPRSLATATAFDGGVIVAGGEAGNQPAPNAEVFDAKSGSFVGDPIVLAQPRAEQGAVLLANGEVLLVGGVGADGGLFPSCVAIDPATHHATSAGLATLQTSRVNPKVLRLTSGEVLVLGGTDVAGKPVSSIEWFSKDATQSTGLASLPASNHEAFVALPGGGALAVISPDLTGPTTTFVITPDHQVQQAAPISSLPPAATLHLFDGADGAPLLWTGTSWFRWSPWQGAFVSFAEATSADGTPTANGPASDAITASVDSGLAIWMENTGINAGRVLGLRFDARGAYSTDVRTLLATDTVSIAPDRLPNGVTPDGSGSTLSFDSEHGLTLTKNSAIVVTDATFAGFSLDLDTVELGEPVLFLRDDVGNEFSIGTDAGAVSCGIEKGGHLHVERSGAAITVTSSAASASAGTVTRCSAQFFSSARVSIGLRGRASTAVPCTAKNLVIRR